MKYNPFVGFFKGASFFLHRHFPPVQAAADLPQPAPPVPSVTEVFENIQGATQLPPLVVKEDFAGIQSTAELPQEVASSSFAGVSGEALVTEKVDVDVFEGVVGGLDLSLEFPGGGKVRITEGMGVPLGAEKPLAPSKLRREED